MSAGADTKRCWNCKEIKPLTDFCVDRTRVDGRHTRCRACRAYIHRTHELARINHEKRKTHYQRNKDRILAKQKEWRLRSANIVNAKRARQRATLVKATPSWADKRKINTFYKEAMRLTKETGVKHQVDHIVPLNSPNVCGLHCEHNLQILPALQNILKGNRFIEEYVYGTAVRAEDLPSWSWILFILLSGLWSKPLLHY